MTGKCRTVVVTGACSAIGHAVIAKFIKSGDIVHGIDEYESTLTYPNYTYHCCSFDNLPDIHGVDILVNCIDSHSDYSEYMGTDIQLNLVAVMKCTEKYGIREGIKSILNVSSVAGRTGADFPEYVASKGGLTSYSIWTAKQVARYGATCNSLSVGGVLMPQNDKVMSDDYAWQYIMNETPLSKWADVSEIADWVYFFTCINKSCTGQDLIIDNGEFFNHQFVWA